MNSHIQSRQANQLIFSGFVLFFLGLLIGLFIQNLTNPRMGLSAHLEGVMNGMFLMILGLIWNRLYLSRILLNTTFWLVIYGALANVLAVVIAAVTGFGKMMPIAGGREGIQPIEGLISFLLISLALSMLAACIIVLIGLYKNLRNVPANE